MINDVARQDITVEASLALEVADETVDNGEA